MQSRTNVDATDKKKIFVFHCRANRIMISSFFDHCAPKKRPLCVCVLSNSAAAAIFCRRLSVGGGFVFFFISRRKQKPGMAKILVLALLVWKRNPESSGTRPSLLKFVMTQSCGLHHKIGLRL